MYMYTYIHTYACMYVCVYVCMIYSEITSKGGEAKFKVSRNKGGGGQDKPSCLRMM